jgi:hypothetical protein
VSATHPQRKLHGLAHTSGVSSAPGASIGTVSVLAGRFGNSTTASTAARGPSSSASTPRGAATAADSNAERWARLSAVGLATARQIASRIHYGYTIVEISRGLRIPQSCVRSLVEELAIELNENAPSADDLRALGRRL